MNITLTDSLLLIAVLALLIINFATRRIATAQASRMFVKDHIKNIRHHNHHQTMLVLRDRLSLMTGTLIFSVLGAASGFVSASFVIFGWQTAAKAVFVVGIFFGLVSLLQSLRESFIANKSHFGELDATVSKDDPYYGAGAP
ncbi:MAG: DUF2721 domain-containing protein [Candidatus Saccharimonadales bacterium]